MTLVSVCDRVEIMTSTCKSTVRFGHHQFQKSNSSLVGAALGVVNGSSRVSADAIGLATIRR